MRTELRKLPKSKTSWPKSVVKKWLNKKNEAHHGFHSTHSAIGTMNERRKSCSDQEYYDVVKNDFSEEWRYEKEESPVDLKMFVGTWNLGGKSPSASDKLNLMEWLKSPSQADIYVIGFQEIVPLNAGNVLGPEDSGPADKWLSLIRQALNCGCDEERQESPKPRLSLSDREFTRLYSGETSPWSPFTTNPQPQYCLAASKQMVGIFLCVWLRQDLFQYLSYLNVSCVGTGIMGYLGNKGSISISMTLYHTTFCFVCTHLTSGEKDGDEVRRNLDVSEILKRTKFSRSFKLTTTPESILQHQNVIWLGDLNYRLASGGGDTYELLEKNDWQALLEKDQLRIEKRAGRVFEGWNEGKICFAPTYKYLPNSDHYVVQTKSKEKRRTPAWCDRILWKGEGVKQKWYVRGESKFSDHRPVYSLFSVKVDTSKKVISIPPNYYNNNNNNTASCGSVSARHTSNTTGLSMSSSCQAKVQAEEQLLLITRAHSCIETAPRL